MTNKTEPMVMIPAALLSNIEAILVGRVACTTGSVIEQIESSRITDPAAMAAELRKMLGQEPEAWLHNTQGRVDCIHKTVKDLLVKFEKANNTEFYREVVKCKTEHYTIPLYLSPQPTPDYAVAIERAADVCEEARAREVKSVRDYTDSFTPNLARDHKIRADELGHSVEAIRALMPAGVEVTELDREPYGLELVTAIWDAQAAGKRVYIVTVAP